MRRQAVHDAKKVVAHLGAQPRVLDHARTCQQHGEAAGGADDRFFELGFTGEHIVQREFGVEIEHHVQVGQPEVGVKHQHAVATFGQSCR